MAQSIHYEIFCRQGAQGGWKMIDVRTERESALAFAQSLMTDEHAAAVKVVKETYNDETGDYLTLKIFETGHEQLKTVPAQEDMPHALPCFKPEDLYSAHARPTITRLIGEFLVRSKITLTELGHRADMLQKLEATGTMLQHAIQKLAVAQAASTTTPVAQIIKSLNELATGACNKVYRDERKNYFRVVPASGFGALARELSDKADAAYQFNGAIAKHLKDAKGWDEKVLRLVALMDQTSPQGAGRTLLLTSVDTIVAEILASSAALHELIGAKEHMGQALMSLAQLFLGQEAEAAIDGAGLIALTKRFAADELPEARAAIANRIMAEFKSAKRLCPNSLEEEFKRLRQIANLLVHGIGKHLSHDDLIGAFTLRSKRLVTHETLGEHMADAATPDEKLERLLLVEENIIGAENKRLLATFVVPVITASNFEVHFTQSRTPVLSRLQKLAALQARVRRSGFQDSQRQELAELLDKLACMVEAKAKLFESIDTKSPSPVERAVTILKLFRGAVLTEGQLAAQARERLMQYLARPGFVTAYLAQSVLHDERQTADSAKAELMAALDQAGIAAEAGLKSHAA